MLTDKKSSLKTKAIFKKASLKKQASAFKTLRIPVDQNGDQILRNDNNQYVLSDGVTLYDPAIHGAVRFKSRPVLSESDLTDYANFPIQSKILKLKKYQSIVKELRDAVKTAESGIVNFVIGNETDVADAILKYAFPPGSGIVYKGIEGDGYDINTYSMGGLDAAKKQLIKILKGNPKGYDKKSMDYFKRLSQEWGLAPVEQGQARLIDPMRIIDPSSTAPARPQSAAAPLPGVMRPNPNRPAAPEQTQSGLDAIYNEIESVKATLSKTEESIRNLSNIHDTDPNPNDPEGLSDYEKYKKLTGLTNLCRNRLAALQRELPQVVDSNGDPEYDGTGFLDSKIDTTTMYGKLHAVVDVPLPPSTREGGTPEIIAAYQRQTTFVINNAVEILSKIRNDALNNGMSNKDKLIIMCSQLINNLNNGHERVMKIKKAYEEAIKMVLQELQRKNAVLILNNLDRSGMVPRGEQETSATSLTFLADDILAQHFANPEAHKGKAIILVSRVPIKISVGSLTIVPREPDAFLVDDEEAAVLIRFYVDQARQILIKKMQAFEGKKNTGKELSLSDIDINSRQITSLAQIIGNKSHVSAKHFLVDIFNRVLEENSGALPGGQLIKEARKANNSDVKNDRWTPQGEAGSSQPMFAKEAKLQIEFYIYSKRTEWGAKVEEINNIALEAMSKEAYAKKVAEKIHAINSGLAEATPEEVTELENTLEETETKTRQSYNKIKHFMILYGAPGCGKSAYPEALANQLGFDLLDVNFSQARGSLVGQTERFTAALLSSWKRLTNVVIRLDELDGQFVSEAEEGRESYNASAMTQLLTFFQDNEQLLIDRNIFVVATTNHLERIREALIGRAALQEVPMPFDQEGYETYLNSAMDIMQSAGRKYGLMEAVEKTKTSYNSNLWPETEAFWETLAPDFPRMASALVPSGLNFRKANDFIVEMFTAHAQYLETTERLRIYKTNLPLYKEMYSAFVRINRKTKEETWPEPKVDGFPFTADNFCKAASMTYPINEAGERVDPRTNREKVLRIVTGVDALKRQLREVPDNKPKQPELNFDFSETEQTLMPEMNDDSDDLFSDVVASNDYYYSHLLKSGFKNRIAQLQQAEQAEQAEQVGQTQKVEQEDIGQVKPDLPDENNKVTQVQNKPIGHVETTQEQMDRISKGDIREQDIFEAPGIAVYPIPNPKTFK